MSDTWIGGTGDWDTPTNWSANAKPGALDGAVFNTTAHATLTNVEFENIASLLLSAATAAVDIEGTLTIGGAHLNGVPNSIDVTAGSLTVDGGGLIAGQFVTEASGTVHITHGGTYQWNGSGATQTVDLGKSANDTFQFSTQFGGQISNFYAGDLISYSGAVNSVVIGTNTVTFNAANGQSYVLDFTGGPYNSNNLFAFGNLLETTLLPAVTINSSLPAGYTLPDGVQQLTIGSAVVIGGTGVNTAPDHPVDILNFGSVTGSPAGMTLAGGGSVTNGGKNNPAASISGNKAIVFQAVGTVTNFGTLTGTGGTAIQFVDGQPNRLIEQGTGIVNGSVSGGGGTLELGAQGGVGTLGGLGTGFKNFNVVQVDAGAKWSLSGTPSIAATAVLNNSGMLSLPGALSNKGQVNNLAGATLDIAGDFGLGATGAFSNAGLLEKISGAGTSLIRTGASPLAIGGTTNIQIGTLELMGSTVSITGNVKGAGMLELGTGTTTVGGAAALGMAGLSLVGTGADLVIDKNLTYAGAFSAGTSTELSISSGNTLKLTGPAAFTNATVDGAGVLTTSGTTTFNQLTLGGTAQWLNAGILNQTGGSLVIGDAGGNVATFDNQTAGAFSLIGNIVKGTGASIFRNHGLLTKTSNGTSAIGIAITNVGTIETANGVLDLQQDVQGNGGILRIDAGKALQADGAVTGQTVDFGGGHDRLILTDALEFAGKLQDFGAADRIDLREFDPATTTLAFAENGAMTSGKLTVTDGALQVKITLMGQFAASGFQAASDGAPGGTFVTYTPPPAMALTVPHGG